MSHNSKNRIQKLRAALAGQGLQGFIIPRADEYQGEFVAPYAERLRWLTGFSGSGGMAIVLDDTACAMTDGRYLLQIRDEVDTDVYEIIDYTKTPPGEWLASHAPKSAVIGYDPHVMTGSQIQKMREHAKDIALKSCPNLIDAIWDDQPARPGAPVIVFSEEIAGQSAEDKIAQFCKDISAHKADYALICAPDSVGWLLNVRGSDIPYYPFIHSFALLSVDGVLNWFIDGTKLNDDVRAHLPSNVIIHDPQSFDAFAGTLSGKTIVVDYSITPIWFTTHFEKAGAKIKGLRDPCLWPRSQKSAAEQDAIRKAHMRDGAALVRFLQWLSAQDPDGHSEISVQDKLAAFRALDPSFKEPSFPTICGFGPHGAVIHYRASQATDMALADGNLLLIDSGGQYYDPASGVAGTTDITRTIAIGQPSAEHQESFTRVLKGHISLAMAQFPQGTSGAQLDTLARGALWQAGQDYAHGTGHGVGCYSSVHEEAAHISGRGTDPILPGMLLSNEPGYYKEGHYGIRIENLVLAQEGEICVDTGKPMLFFDTLSLAPIDRTLIVKEMLSHEELEWLNGYHARVYTSLEPLLRDDEKVWLETQVSPL